MLGWGADVDVQNKANKTAGEMASENDKAEVSSLLAGYKSDANVQHSINSSTLDLVRSDAHGSEDEETISLHTAAEEGTAGTHGNGAMAVAIQARTAVARAFMSAPCPISKTATLACPVLDAKASGVI